MPDARDRLRAIKTFKDLIGYLEEELGWPLLDEYSFDELTFEYSPQELGLREQDVAKVRAVHQLRPLQQGQPWGIFFVEFESKRMPIVVLRRILSHLVVKRRASASKAKAPTWHLDDLLFISAFGDEATDQREIAFAHFHQEAGDLPTLRVLGWDGADTPLKLDHVAAVLDERLRWPGDPDDADAWRRQWAPAFRHRVGHIIRTADALADRLAELARGIRDGATTLMAHETENGPLRQLHKAFQAALIHDLSEGGFADTYAQTITYGLLTAAISRTEMTGGAYGTMLVAGNVTDMVPITNPFLRDMLQAFLEAGGRRGGIDFDELGIQDVVELLRGEETDLPAILRDFGNRTRGEDPVIHFYEHFLAAYDRELKVQRGIFYTPQPIVSYIVHRIHELLRTEFGLEDGLSSTVTWRQMAQRHPQVRLPKGVEPESAFVQILDPAAGTGTFLVEAIDLIHETLTTKWRRAGLNDALQHEAWNDYVPKHLLPRLCGYELMMAPYAIAHMKIPLKLRETGFTGWSNLRPQDRVRVYLTNSLEPPESESQPAFAGWAPALAREAQAVNAVKSSHRFTVVIGNPPYANFGRQNQNPWIRALLEDYKSGLQERKINLDDDYVKFIRYAQEAISSTSVGIWGYISNNSFYDGLTHRKMREALLETYHALSVLDLHGNALAKEKADDGSADENVFDIQQGVGITIGVRTPGGSRRVTHSSLLGTRDAKYAYLLDAQHAKRAVTILSPASPHFFLVPRESRGREEYESFLPVTDLFHVVSYGIQTKQDALFVDFSQGALAGRMAEIIADVHRLGEVRASHKHGLGRSSGWSASRLANARYDRRCIRPIYYRPFDFRWIYYDPESLGRARYGTMKHMLHENLALIIMRQVFQDIDTYSHFGATNLPIDERTFYSNRGGTYLFPLYTYEEEDSLWLGASTRPSRARSVNLTASFLSSLRDRLGLAVVADEGDFATTVGAQDVMGYMLAVFHSPTYRSNYKESLKIGFPRLPLTSKRQLFSALARVGRQLTTVYTTGVATPAERPAAYVGAPRPKVSGAFYSDGTIWIDKPRTQGFAGVPNAVWTCQVGGYRVCEKWLKDRRGRFLSVDDIKDYRLIVASLAEILRLMREVDDIIDEYGGWPEAFAASPAEAP